MCLPVSVPDLVPESKVHVDILKRRLQHYAWILQQTLHVIEFKHSSGNSLLWKSVPGTKGEHAQDYILSVTQYTGSILLVTHLRLFSEDARY